VLFGLMTTKLNKLYYYYYTKDYRPNPWVNPTHDHVCRCTLFPAEETDEKLGLV